MPDASYESRLLTSAKLAMRITVTGYDADLLRLIRAAQQDLGVAGVTLPKELDELVETAIITYCRLNFGSPADYDRLERSYNNQKAQLSTHTGHTTWTDEEAET